jgi:myosin heavy subunit
MTATGSGAAGSALSTASAAGKGGHGPVSPSTSADAASDVAAAAVASATKGVRVGELYWKQAGDLGWALGQVAALDADTAHATFVAVDEATGAPIAGQEPEELDLVATRLYAANPLGSTASDMTSLRHLHEAAIMKNLEDRSAVDNQRPYTFMANVLIAVNPLRYLEEPDKMLFVGQPLDHCPPHPYNIAEVSDLYGHMHVANRELTLLPSALC